MTAVKIDHHKKTPIVLCGSIHYVIKIWNCYYYSKTKWIIWRP